MITRLMYLNTFNLFYLVILATVEQMQRILFRRLAPIRRLAGVLPRHYFAIEMDDSDAEDTSGFNDATLPTARLVNGRYVSSICPRGKKSFKDVLTWLWTKKQNRLSLPSFKFHDKENILQAAVDYTALANRQFSKMTWVRELLHR